MAQCITHACDACMHAGSCSHPTLTPQHRTSMRQQAGHRAEYALQQVLMQNERRVLVVGGWFLHCTLLSPSTPALTPTAGRPTRRSWTGCCDHQTRCCLQLGCEAVSGAVSVAAAPPATWVAAAGVAVAGKRSTAAQPRRHPPEFESPLLLLPELQDPLCAREQQASPVWLSCMHMHARKQ